MKKKIIHKKHCENCKKLFDENDLDMNNGKFVCRECEEYEK